MGRAATTQANDDGSFILSRIRDISLAKATNSAETVVFRCQYDGFPGAPFLSTARAWEFINFKIEISPFQRRS